MTVRGSKNGTFRRLLFWRRRLGRKASFAVEFAIVGPIFFLLLFTVFEISFDLFNQEVLDSALQYTARQVQVGNTQGASATSFVSTYFCPNDGGLLNCNSVYVRIEHVNFGTASCADFYDATSGHLPETGNTLELGYYYSGAGAVGLGTKVGNSTCDNADSSTGFVNAPSQSCILMSAVYVAPSFLTGLVLNRINYNGHSVRAAFSTAAFVTEPFGTSTTAASC